MSIWPMKTNFQSAIVTDSKYGKKIWDYFRNINIVAFILEEEYSKNFK